MIPNIIHFNFGMSSDFGNKPFSLVHYLAVRSAVEVNNPDKVYMWYGYEPDTIWWKKALEFVTPVKIQIPTKIFNRELLHPAHRSDVVRLDKLITHGGIYLDCDVICIRPFTSLLNGQCVMGQQGTRGLCNATMLAESNAQFLRSWLDSYRTFRSKGRDKYWDEHPVRVPARLAQTLKSCITILGPKAFFYPLWHSRKEFFTEEHDLTSDSYSVHLWEQYSWPIIKDFTVEYLLVSESEFAGLVRPYLKGLQDD